MPSLPPLNPEILIISNTDAMTKRAINQKSRSPVLHKRHGPAWQAMRAHQRGHHHSKSGGKGHAHHSGGHHHKSGSGHKHGSQKDHSSRKHGEDGDDSNKDGGHKIEGNKPKEGGHKNEGGDKPTEGGHKKEGDDKSKDSNHKVGDSDKHPGGSGDKLEPHKGGDKGGDKGSDKGGDKGSANSGPGKGITGGNDKSGDHGTNGEGFQHGEKPGAEVKPPGRGGDTRTPRPSDPNPNNQAKDPLAPSPDSKAIPGTPFFANTGSAMVPLDPYSKVGSKLSPPPSLPSSSHPVDDKSFGPKVITYTLIPLTVIAGLAYGVIAYRRNNRRRQLRRRIQEDVEAAAAAAAALSNSRDDDAASVMSEVSYRPPAPFTSEVDVTTQSLEHNNPDVVSGSDAPHLISAPKRDEARTSDYQDYSHVCQAQILGKRCTNHSISCFVALNHSSGGLNATAAVRSAPGPNANAVPPLVTITEKAEEDALNP